MLLRASERARRVVHVPQLLYHWRVLPGSTAAGGREKPASFEAGRRAVQEAFNRRGVACEVVIPTWAERDGSAIFQPVMNDEGPRVAILVVEEDIRSSQLMLSWLELSAYKNFHVYVVGGDGRKLKSGKNWWNHDLTTIKGSDRPRAALWNQLVEEVEEELILFLDGRATIDSPRFLSQMVGWLGLQAVGAVGPRVVDDKGASIRRACGSTSSRGVGKVFDGLPVWDQGYLNLARVARNVSALSSVCMMTDRRTFMELGGFDAETFPDDLFAVDYSLRLRARGLRCVVSAETEVVVPRDATPRAARLAKSHSSACVITISSIPI